MFDTSLHDIIDESVLTKVTMTFSEYIKLIAWEQYLVYCKQKGFSPVKDIEVSGQEKLCALVDKNFLNQPKPKNA